MAIGIDDERPAGRYVDAPEMWRSRSGNAFSASWAWLRAHSGFTVIVVIPSLLGALYYFVIAAPIYASYAQFEVKEASQNTSLSGLGSFLQATGVTNVTNDAYTVDTYLQSRDALRELVKNPGIDKIYARPEADFLVHFPAFYMPSSFEYLWWHYTWWTSADLNTDSNVTTLSVYAFRPKDAQILADRMLTLAETEVNRLNDRVRQDTVKSARHEVEMLQKRSQEIQDQITEFRNRELLLNPEETSSQAVTLLSTLEGQLVANRSTLIQLETSAPRSPQIPALRNQVAALESQVAAEQRKGAGGSETLAPKIAVYNQLLLKQQQVSTMLTAAVTALEGAEATILQQQLYISRVEEANLPDYPWYPYRTIYTLVVLVSSLLVYGIGKVIVTAIREHVA